MLYKNLGEIKLSAFIEAVTGDVRAVIKDSGLCHTDDDCQDAVRNLMMQYIDVCGSTEKKIKLERHKQILFLSVKSKLIEICENLFESGLSDNVVPLLMKLGYKLNPNDKDGISRRIKQLKGKVNFDLELINKNLVDNSGRNMSKSDFTKERVAIMTHYKMHIDPDVFTAEEYACLVAQFNREVDDMIKRNARANK